MAQDLFDGKPIVCEEESRVYPLIIKSSTLLRLNVLYKISLLVRD